MTSRYIYHCFDMVNDCKQFLQISRISWQRSLPGICTGNLLDRLLSGLRKCLRFGILEQSSKDLSIHKTLPRIERCSCNLFRLIYVGSHMFIGGTYLQIDSSLLIVIQAPLFLHGDGLHDMKPVEEITQKSK